MADEYLGTEMLHISSKAEFTALVLNQQINELIITNSDGVNCKDKIIITICGYGGDNEIKILRSDPLSKYMELPLKIATIKKRQIGINGESIFLEEEMPIFVEPQANGTTPMGKCFKKVNDFLIKQYQNDSIDKPAPVIINISDGMPYEGNKESNSEPELSVREAQKMQALQFLDGNPILYNVHIGDSADECSFVSEKSEIRDDDTQAQFLFSISSQVPEHHREAALNLALKRP